MRISFGRKRIFLTSRISGKLPGMIGVERRVTSCLGSVIIICGVEMKTRGV